MKDSTAHKFNAPEKYMYICTNIHSHVHIISGIVSKYTFYKYLVITHINSTPLLIFLYAQAIIRNENENNFFLPNCAAQSIFLRARKNYLSTHRTQRIKFLKDKKFLIFTK